MSARRLLALTSTHARPVAPPVEGGYGSFGWTRAFSQARSRLTSGFAYVRAAGRATVDEEMSEAYKDAADVIEATHGAGLGRRVARLRPLLVVKG